MNHEFQLPKSHNTTKTFVEWNNERKLSLALACHRHKGHLSSKILHMTYGGFLYLWSKKY